MLVSVNESCKEFCQVVEIELGFILYSPLLVTLVLPVLVEERVVDFIFLFLDSDARILVI